MNCIQHPNGHKTNTRHRTILLAPQALERLVDGLTTEPHKLAAAAASATAAAAAAERAAAAAAAAASAAPSDDNARARSAAAAQEAASAAGRAREAAAAAGAAPVPSASEDERVALLLLRGLLPQCKARLGEPNLAVRQVRCPDPQGISVSASLGNAIRMTDVLILLRISSLVDSAADLG